MAFLHLTERDNVTILDLGELAIKLGLPTSLLLFFVWENRRKDTAKDLRLTALETFQTKVLIKMVADSAELQAQSNLRLSESTRTIETALRILERKDT